MWIRIINGWKKLTWGDVGFFIVVASLLFLFSSVCVSLAWAILARTFNL